MNEKDLNKIIVKATITDWTGNILHEFEGKDSYIKALDIHFGYNDDEVEDIFLNSYDKDGVNHGIVY